MPFHFHWDDFSDAFSGDFLRYETEKELHPNEGCAPFYITEILTEGIRWTGCPIR